MTDHVQIVREALGRHWEAMEMVDLTDEVDPALAALAALEAELKAAWATSDDYAACVAEIARLTEALREIAGTDGIWSGDIDRVLAIARAALGEDE